MIFVSLRLDKKGCLLELKSKGHAEKKGLLAGILPGVQKWNSICSAFSMLEYSFLYSVRELLELNIEPEISAGLFTLKIDGGGDESLRLLSQSFVLGVRSLASKYPDQVKLDLITET